MTDFIARTSSGARRISARVRLAMEHVDRSYHDSRLRLQAVARQVGLSAHHLSHLIKRETGAGFRAHLIKRRLREARRHLITGIMSIKEIAAAVGYDSTSHFDREFRRLHGCSPTVWRRRFDDEAEPQLGRDTREVAAAGDLHQNVDQSQETSTAIDCGQRTLHDTL